MSTSLKIVADQQITLAAKAFSMFGDLHLVNGRQLTANDITDADVLLVRSVTRVNQALLENANVRFVGSATSGIDHIDTNYLSDKNIEFHYAAGSNARSVAEYVLSALLFLANKYQFTLQGKTIGIVGVGNVGSRVHDMMQSIGLSCLLNDPPRAEREPDFPHTELNELCEQSDILTFHTPLIEDGPHATRGLLNKELLDKIKEKAIIINTSRGDVVDETALISYMVSHPRAKVILDVWQNEPTINSELVQHADISTPHIAGYSFDGKLKATEQLHQAVANWSGISINPIENHSEIVIECEKTSETDVLYDVVKQAYDVQADSEQLKATLDLSVEERGQFFDQLRKNYPVRREFEQITVKTATSSPVLTRLGFKQA